jgi:hypothetical protein
MAGGAVEIPGPNPNLAVKVNHVLHSVEVFESPGLYPAAISLLIEIAKPPNREAREKMIRR